MRGKAGRIWLAFLLVGLLGGCASPGADRQPTVSKPLAHVERNSRSATSFYVGSHGWHTSIIVPRIALRKCVWPEGVIERTFRGCAYLEAGWGDRTFYMAAKPNVATAFDAVFLPGASVLHVVGLDPPLESAFAWTGLVRMPCSEAELRNVCAAIGDSFATDANGRAEDLGHGLYGKVSRFYPAHGRYYFANTCNNWTARMMRAGGFPTDTGPTGTWSAGAVMAQALRLARARVSTANSPAGTAR